MAAANDPDKLHCPCCGKHRPIAGTTLLRAEAEWLATGAFDTRRGPGWSIAAARAGQLQWACTQCVTAGRALAGHPAVQRWCDYNPYIAFFDVSMGCSDCGRAFVFAATEQKYWYETLKFWVQSRPKQCVPCRRARRERARANREDQAQRGRDNDARNSGSP